MRLVLEGPAGAAVAPMLLPDEPPGAPGPGTVLVGMQWGGCNRIDRMLCEGRVARPEGVHVLGGQGGGRIVAAGPGVEDLEPGRLVALYPYGGCGSCDRCAAGNETLCRGARLDGVNAPGVFTSQ